MPSPGSTADARREDIVSSRLETFDVVSPDGYVAQLRERHVLVDRDERATTMMARVSEAARALGGVHDDEPSLVDENASLVEEPHVVTGSFDPALLTLAGDR